MDRRMVWCVPLAWMLLPAAEAAEPGFYIGATASRVEQDVEGGIGGPLVFGDLPPLGGFFPPPAFGTPILNPIIIPISPPFAVSYPPLPDRVEVDDGQAGWSVTLGYRVNQYFAAELAYVDFGETEVTQYHTFASLLPRPPLTAVTRYDMRVSGPAVSVLGSLPLGASWQVFLRGGVLFADQEIEYDVSGRLETTYGDEVLMAGAGVQWAFASRWTARLEYQLTDDLRQNPVAGESQLEQASLSVLFSL